VENSKQVWLEPPRQELSNAQSRCVDQTPSQTTTYVLTAQGASGDPVTEKVTVNVSEPAPSAPRARIGSVTFTSLDIKRGDVLGICYQAENAKSVTVDPIHFTGPGDHGCTHLQPTETTTFVVTAIGANGEKDQERGTVKVH
jgi:hypothetical protein